MFSWRKFLAAIQIAAPFPLLALVCLHQSGDLYQKCIYLPPLLCVTTWAPTPSTSAHSPWILPIHGEVSFSNTTTLRLGTSTCFQNFLPPGPPPPLLTGLFLSRKGRAFWHLCSTAGTHIIKSGWYLWSSYHCSVISASFVYYSCCANHQSAFFMVLSYVKTTGHLPSSQAFPAHPTC